MATIEYFYSAHSAYAYLGARRLMEICAAHGATLIHKPFALSPVIEAQGARSFRERTQAHVDYFFGREIERWAAWRNIEIVSFRPTHHDADYTLASCLILELGDHGAAVNELSFALLEAHWRDDVDLSDEATLLRIAQTCGHDPEALLARARSNDVFDRYQANTQEAGERPVFGSPTYIVDGDPFYGQDRLEQIDHALKTPFAPTAWQNPSVDA